VTLLAIVTVIAIVATNAALCGALLHGWYGRVASNWLAPTFVPETTALRTRLDALASRFPSLAEE
jgi:hypothetical protein